MRTKFELKLNIKRLSRQVEECERYERAFVSAQKLCHTGKNTSMYGKLFKRVEDKRTLWWKSSILIGTNLLRRATNEYY